MRKLGKSLGCYEVKWNPSEKNYGVRGFGFVRYIGYDAINHVFNIEPL